MSKLVLETEFPNNWCITSLGDVITPIKGKKPKTLGEKNAKFTIPYITIQTFEKNIFENFTDDVNCPRCNENDVLMVWDGSRSGLVGTGVNGVIGSTIAKLFCYDINPKYLYYFLQKQYDTINKNPKGIGIPHVNPTILLNLKFPIPPFNEQKRIVTKIEDFFFVLKQSAKNISDSLLKINQIKQSLRKSAYDGNFTLDWREKHPTYNTNMKIIEVNNIRKSAFQKLLDLAKKEHTMKPKKPINLEIVLDLQKKPITIPDTWELLSFKDIASTKEYSISSGPFGSSLGTKDYVQNGIPIIRGANIKNGKFVSKDFVYVTKATSDKLKRSSIYPNDLIIVAVGASGSSCIVPESIQFGIMSQNCNKFTLDSNIVFSHYVNQFLQLQLTKENLTSKITDTARPFLSLTNLKKLSIPIPPIEEQKEILRILDEYYFILDKANASLENQRKKIQLLYHQILQHAFEGKLTTQDPNDKSAEILLQKIKQEKIKVFTQDLKTRKKKNDK